MKLRIRASDEPGGSLGVFLFKKIYLQKNLIEYRYLLPLWCCCRYVGINRSHLCGKEEDENRGFYAWRAEEHTAQV